MNVESFNAAAAEDLRAPLLACCDVDSWVEQVLAGRPYADVDAVAEAASAACAALSPEEISQALAAHPRIGDRPTSESREAAWSRSEQSGVSTDEATQRALAEGNRAYEERFDRVFLICATGLAAEQILAELRRRLNNEDAAEVAEVGVELSKIAALRVRKLFADSSPAAGTRSTITTHVLDTALGQPASGVAVVLERVLAGGDEPVAQGRTDDDGRITNLGPAQIAPGTYRLRFDTAGYCAASGQACFFPEVAITFVLPASAQGGTEHHHVPLLLSPFSYSTYRGS